MIAPASREVTRGSDDVYSLPDYQEKMSYSPVVSRRGMWVILYGSGFAIEGRPYRNRTGPIIR